MQRIPNLLLLDIETTGLCQDTGSKVLEVAMTPVYLNRPISEGLVDQALYRTLGKFAVNIDNIFCQKLWVPRDEEIRVSPWIRNTHGENGNKLIPECHAEGMRPHQLEQKALAWLTLNGFVPGKVIPAGNSVWTDRVHLMRHLPALERTFFHRNFDFSSFKVAAATFGIPEDEDPEKKGDNHRAKPGLFAALGRLNFYWESMIKPAIDEVQS